MGGRPQPAPKTYSPMEQAQAQLTLDNASAERQERAAAAERQRVAEEKQRNTQRTADDANRLYTEGQSYGASKAANTGFEDTYGLQDTYNRGLSATRSKIPAVSDNVGAYYDYDQLWNNATNEVQSAQATRLDNQFRSKTPVGWESSYFADTADDGILEAILGEQYGASFDTLDAARARGQLSEGAFGNALRGLDSRKSAARATLEDMGLGVLSGYRDQLKGVRDQYSDQIANYKLGQNINLDDFTSQLTSRADALRGRMQGDITRAVGDTALFNTDSIMAKGASAAGVSNNPLRNAFRNPAAVDPERTTGTTGVF